MAWLPQQLNPAGRTLDRMLWGQRGWTAPQAMHVDAGGRVWVDGSAQFVTSRRDISGPAIQVSRRFDGFHVFAKPRHGLLWQRELRMRAAVDSAEIPVARVHTGIAWWDALKAMPLWKIALGVAIVVSPALLMIHGVGATVAGAIAATGLVSPALVGAAQRWISQYGPGWAADVITSILFPNATGTTTPSVPVPPGPCIPTPSPCAPQPCAPPPCGHHCGCHGERGLHRRADPPAHGDAPVRGDAPARPRGAAPRAPARRRGRSAVAGLTPVLIAPDGSMVPVLLPGPGWYVVAADAGLAFPTRGAAAHLRLVAVPAGAVIQVAAPAVPVVAPIAKHPKPHPPRQPAAGPVAAPPRPAAKAAPRPRRASALSGL